jgi:hypothetical protein
MTTLINISVPCQWGGSWILGRLFTRNDHAPSQDSEPCVSTGLTYLLEFEVTVICLRIRNTETFQSTVLTVHADSFRSFWFPHKYFFSFFFYEAGKLRPIPADPCCNLTAWNTSPIWNNKQSFIYIYLCYFLSYNAISFLMILKLLLYIKQDRSCSYKRNTEARLRNHCCHGKILRITHSEFVCVALVIQHAMRTRRIVIRGLLPSICEILNNLLQNIDYALLFIMM